MCLTRLRWNSFQGFNYFFRLWVMHSWSGVCLLFPVPSAAQHGCTDEQVAAMEALAFALQLDGEVGLPRLGGIDKATLSHSLQEEVHCELQLEGDEEHTVARPSAQGASCFVSDRLSEI